jgi:hypothetical protein
MALTCFEALTPLELCLIGHGYGNLSTLSLVVCQAQLGMDLLCCQTHTIWLIYVLSLNGHEFGKLVDPLPLAWHRFKPN